MIRLVLIIIGTLALTSCAGTLAKLKTEADYLHEAGDQYVRWVHGFRKWIREECKASVIREVDEKKNNKEITERDIRKFLREVHPKLVTFDIVDQARKDPTKILAYPPGCEPPVEPGS